MPPSGMSEECRKPSHLNRPLHLGESGKARLCSLSTDMCQDTGTNQFLGSVPIVRCRCTWVTPAHSIGHFHHAQSATGSQPRAQPNCCWSNVCDTLAPPNMAQQELTTTPCPHSQVSTMPCQSHNQLQSRMFLSGQRQHWPAKAALPASY